MDKDFCRQIDKQFLVEDYVAGKLKGELLNKFEQHISQCANHARAVALEKAMRKGIIEHARGEIKSKLHERLKKKEDVRVMFLRYAAILLVAVITPLLIYYQFYITPEQLSLPLSPEESYKQHAVPDDSLSSEKYLSEKSKSETKITTPPKNETIIAKDEKLKIDDVEKKRKAEFESDTPDPSSPPPVAEEELSDESPIEDKIDLPRLAAEELAENPTVATGTQSVIRSAGGQRKMAVTSHKEMNSLQAQINSHVVRDSVRLKSCMETYFTGEQLDTYTISLQLSILNSGEIGQIEILDAKLRSEELESCLQNVINKWLVTPDEKQRTIEVNISYKQKY